MATAVFQWRYFNYPADYTYVRMPVANFLFITPVCAEPAYPSIFFSIAKTKRKQKGEKALEDLRASGSRV